MERDVLQLPNLFVLDFQAITSPASDMLDQMEFAKEMPGLLPAEQEFAQTLPLQATQPIFVPLIGLVAFPTEKAASPREEPARAT